MAARHDPAMLFPNISHLYWENDIVKYILLIAGWVIGPILPIFLEELSPIHQLRDSIPRVFLEIASQVRRALPCIQQLLPLGGVSLWLCERYWTWPSRHVSFPRTKWWFVHSFPMKSSDFGWFSHWKSWFSSEFGLDFVPRFWRRNGTYLSYPLVMHSYGESPFFMGKSTISMAIFHSYVSHYQRVNPINSHAKPPFSHGFPIVFGPILGFRKG